VNSRVRENQPSWMLRLRILVACLAAVVGLACLGGAAMGSVQDVYADYADNGRIDGVHDPEDLRAAIDLQRQTSQQGGFVEAAADAINDQYLGLDGGRVGAQRSAEVPAPDLPLAPTAAPPGHLPWPFIGLALMAGLLVVFGAGSTAYRRLRRPT
jgi:hypothetical protein